MKNRNIKILNEDGFSLIEVMIAICILLIGMLAIAQMQIAAIQGNGAANRLSKASILGGDAIEKLILLPFNDPSLSDGDHSYSGNPIDGFYNIFWNVTTNTDGNRKDIRLTVTWVERGYPKQVVFVYMKTSVKS